jgi:hypothetical protein
VIGRIAELYELDSETAIPKCVYVQWGVGKRKTPAEKHAEIREMLRRFIVNEQINVIGMQGEG